MFWVTCSIFYKYLLLFHSFFAHKKKPLDKSSFLIQLEIEACLNFISWYRIAFWKLPHGMSVFLISLFHLHASTQKLMKYIFRSLYDNLSPINFRKGIKSGQLKFSVLQLFPEIPLLQETSSSADLSSCFRNTNRSSIMIDHHSRHQ